MEYERSRIALEAHASTSHTVQFSRCKQITVAIASENKLFRGQFVTAISIISRENVHRLRAVESTLDPTKLSRSFILRCFRRCALHGVRIARVEAEVRSSRVEDLN